MEPNYKPEEKTLKGKFGSYFNKKVRNIGNKFEKFGDVVEQTLEGLEGDVTKFYKETGAPAVKKYVGLGQQGAKDLIKTMSEGDYKQILQTIYDTTSGGPKEIKKKLKELYDEKINTAIEKDEVAKPKKAGFWDGYLNVFIKQPCERSAEPAYAEGKVLGKGAAYVTAVPLFLSGGVLGVVLGGLPAWTRLGPYIKSHVLTAKDTVAQKAEEMAQAGEDNVIITPPPKEQKKPEDSGASLEEKTIEVE